MTLAVFLICVNVAALVALFVGGIWHDSPDTVETKQINIEDLK